MKLVSINKRGTQTFLLDDGRLLKSYNTGYVRTFTKAGMIYQINPRKYTEDMLYFGVYNTERILIPCPEERFEFIKNWVNKNIK